MTRQRILDAYGRPAVNTARVNGEVRDMAQGHTIRAQVPGSEWSGNYFEALRPSDDRTPINYSRELLEAQFPETRSYHDSFSRLHLAMLARYIVDNYPVAYQALSLLATCSTPVVPRAAGTNARWNDAAEAYFDEWALNCYWRGSLTWPELQRSISFTVDTDGDVGLQMVRDGESGRLVVKVWPGWRIGAYSIFGKAPEKNELDGVLLDRRGVITGYRVLDYNGAMVVIPADTFLLLYEADRMDRLRGVSTIRQAINDLRDAQDTKAFEKLAAKIDSAVAGVIEGHVLDSDWSDPEQARTLHGMEIPKPITVASLLGGEIPVIPNGSLKTISSGRGSDKLPFIEYLNGSIVSALGISPAFFLDDKLTGPSVRTVIAKAQRRIEQRQYLFERMSRWVWVRVIGDAIAKGALPANKDWTRSRFQKPPKLTIDMGDQLQMELQSFERGLRSRQQYHAAFGENWVDVVEQKIAEDEYILEQLKGLSQRTGIPLDGLMANYGYTPAAPGAPAGNSAGAGAPGPAKGQEANAGKQQVGEGEPAAEESGGAYLGWLPQGASRDAFDVFLAASTSFRGGESNFDPDQPRDNKGRWVETGAEERRKAESEARAERAAKSHKPNTPLKAALSDAVAAAVAKMLGGKMTTDNAPFDVVGKKLAIEVKGLIENANAKITMHPPDWHDPVGSRNRKLIYLRSQEGSQALPFTLAFRPSRESLKLSPQELRSGKADVTKFELFVKVGVGSFRLEGMERIRLADLPKWFESNRSAMSEFRKKAESEPITLFAGMTLAEAAKYKSRIAQYINRGGKSREEGQRLAREYQAKQVSKGRLAVTKKGRLVPIYDYLGRRIANDDGTPLKKG